MFAQHRGCSRASLLPCAGSMPDRSPQIQTCLESRVRADDLQAIKTLVTLGEGIAWLPDFLVEDEAKSGKLVRVLSQWRPKQQQLGTCYFVYAGRGYALPKVESFIQTALELV